MSGYVLLILLAFEPPCVCETVDLILVVEIENYQCRYVTFWRDGNFIAKRIELDDMLWVSDAELFRLIWIDHGAVERVVDAKAVGYLRLETDPFQDRGPWWNMARNMNDLKQP